MIFVDRRELILGFIRPNLSLFTDKDFLVAIYKKKKKEYFLERYSKSKQGLPRDVEIANELIWYLIRNNVVSSSDSLAKYLQLPFLALNIHDSQAYYDSLKLKEHQRPEIDFSRLKKTDLVESLRKQLKEELKYEQTTSKIANIDEEIRKKIEEYNSIPSILDQGDFPEPTPESSALDSEEYIVWWKQLNLTDDPFPATEGLMRIDPTTYESVVVKTPLFQKYQSFIQYTRSEIFKNTIFFGEFGSGKTTLFEYLKRALSSKEVESVYIQLYSEKDLQSLKITFKKKLIEELALYLGNHISDGSLRSYENIDTALWSSLNTLFETKHSKGLVIFIDDLHKNKEDVPVSLEFLSYLQIFTSEILRKISTPNLAFYIAGSLDWEPIIKTQPKYSGSLARRETIPDVTEDEAWAMLNRRLEAFYPNPEVKRVVDKSFVSQVYRDLLVNKLELTFRSFIQRLVDEFNIGNFKVLSSDPVHINSESLTKIKTVVESSPIVKERFNVLLKEKMQNEENRIKALRLLIEIYIKKKIKEEDYIDDRFYLQTLAKTRLIQKAREGPSSFSWVVCKELVDSSKLVADNFSLSLEDYLLKIYGLTSKRRKAASEEVNRLQKLANSNDEGAKEILERVIMLHTKILEAQESYTLSYSEMELAFKCKDSLESLTKFYLQYVERASDEFAVKDLLGFWSTYWFSLEEISRFVELLGNESECKRRIWYVCSIYRQAFGSILRFVEKEYSSLSSLHISSFGINNSQITELVKARDLWVSGLYERSLNALADTMQNAFRTSLQNIFAILFGDMQNRMKQLESDTRTIIRDRLSSLPPSNVGSPREFSMLTLEEIGHILTNRNTPGQSSLWEHVFSKLFEGFTLEDFVEYFNKFSKLRGLSELDSDTSAESRLDLRDLIMTSEGIIRLLESSYFNIVQDGVHLETIDGETTIYISLDGMRDKASLQPIAFTRIKLRNLIQKLTLGEINLSDQVMIEAYYSILYREFFAYIGLLNGRNKNELNIRERFSIERSHGSKIRVGRQYVFNGSRPPQMFISHSSNDVEFARTLAKDLDKRGVKVWLSEMNIKVGDSIPQKINDALENCNFFAIILSNDSVNSEWVMKELSSAFVEELERQSIVVLPILWKPCKIPPLIMDKRYASFTKNYDSGLDDLLSRLTAAS